MPLLRSSQPLTNGGTKRCYEDEQLLRNVRDTCNCKDSYILDTRPSSVATSTRSGKVVVGGGKGVGEGKCRGALAYCVLQPLPPPPPPSLPPPPW